jgi:hypothetical protein
MKDYELHEYALVRRNFDVLLDLPEVRRVVIMGYSGQNPYILGDKNPWVEKFTRMNKVRKGWDERKDVKEGNKERMNDSKEGRVGKLVDINEIIEKNDEIEEQKRREEEERIATETEGLLSGEMV